MSELIFAWFEDYGMAAAFVVLVVTSLGVPLPATLFLMALGSFVALGELELWSVLVLATSAAICGDQLGYALGRFGGRGVVARIERHARAGSLLHRAEAFAARWGALGIFLSRWLVGGLGPWINVTSGVAAYSWPRFVLWDVLGETLWVGIYVTLGLQFSSRVHDLAELVSNLGWLVAALAVAAFAAWELARHLRHATQASTEQGAGQGITR